MRRIILKCLCSLLMSFSCVFGAAQAQADDHPVLDVSTTVNGIEVHNAYTMTDLREFTPTRFVTTTIWTEGEVEFEGVAVDLLLDRLNITHGTLELIAANDYFVQVSVDDLRGTEALLAYSQNDAPMSTRDKGPLWLVFPYDSDVSFQSETFYSRSIWQLRKIKLLP